jgi:hypothetical protein
MLEARRLFPLFLKVPLDDLVCETGFIVDSVSDFLLLYGF